jgi:hypothetical protein
MVPFSLGTSWRLPSVTLFVVIRFALDNGAGAINSVL